MSNRIGATKIIECGRSTAVAYQFRVQPSDLSREPWGWAICTINDETGELNIQSDWTDPAGYRWGADPKSLGTATLTHFLACAGPDYVAGKLLRHCNRDERFSPTRTIRVMRERIGRKRREGDLAKEDARLIWKSLDELAGLEDRHEFVDAIPDDYRDLVFGHTEWEDLRNEPSGEYVALTTLILPALKEACMAAVLREDLPIKRNSRSSR